MVTGWMAVSTCQAADKAKFPQLSDFHTLKLYHATTGGTNEVRIKVTHPLYPPPFDKGGGVILERGASPF